MQQRIYRGSISAESLADYLVQHYEPQEDLQAQKVGQGDSFVVQIARGDTPEEQRHAVTVAIARAPESDDGVLVTMGQQQWITPQQATYAAMIGLIGVLVTPWALFGLLWPVSQLLGSTTLPGDIWNNVETYAASHGAVLSQTQELNHPQLGG